MSTDARLMTEWKENKISAVDVFVLCAGKQTRYQSLTSKMMADIGGRPAFQHTMDTLLAVFPARSIYIITSTLFPDLNRFIRSTYPKVVAMVDHEPGRGTAVSFRDALHAWENDIAFVVEGDIFFTPDLICGSLRMLRMEGEGVCCISVTPHINKAPTHRAIVLQAGEVIILSGVKSETTYLRNIGAYVLRKYVMSSVLADRHTNFIDTIWGIQKADHKVLAYLHHGPYLHLACHKDKTVWESFFLS